jgi:predicted membrane protein
MDCLSAVVSGNVKLEENMENQTELSFAVLVTKKDYLELWKAAPVRFLSWVLFLIAALCLYWASLVFMNYGYTEETYSTIIMYCAVSLFALFGGFVVPRLRTRLAFRGPIFREPRNYSVAEQGIRCESPLFTGLYRWAAFTSVKETKHSFAFFLSPAVALLVPKHCLQTKEDVDLLRGLISKFFQGKKRLRN